MVTEVFLIDDSKADVHLTREALRESKLAIRRGV